MIFALILFWLCTGLLLFTHIGYPVMLWLLDFIGLGGRAGEVRGPKLSEIPPAVDPDTDEELLPSVSLIVAAYNEETVIEAKVRNALELEYPRELLEIIVASDGSSDGTVEIARKAGADLVLDLPRGGKIAAQNAAAEAAKGQLLAFSDANSIWEPGALGELIEPFRDDRVGYVCGQVSFIGPDGGNLEGAYWRYEMRVREMESELAGVTAGNGAIYAVRASGYIPLRPSGSHDLSLPFALAKRRLASLYRPRARATEKLVPSLDGELARKRRMMIGLWDIVVGEGMLDPRGYPPLYLFELFSHRMLRYLSPALHLVAFLTNIVLLGHGWFYGLTMLLQILLLLAALLGRWFPILPLRVARYYVEVTLSIALGLWDRWRQGPPGAWEKAEGTR
ncbi:MAG: glycosyltransferase [Solirubrobacterales bacterium]|nr:glycosyltransferase [Solirubrobacterales bacterium]MCB8914258.1 glycosyltransferase [Thermoleophilales bacterium]